MLTPSGDEDVVHEVLLADERLAEDVIAHVEAEREPLSEVPLRPEAGAAGDADATSSRR